MAIAQVNGVALDYGLVGEGQPLVLVHGSWDSRGVWDAVVPLLTPEFRVLTYSRRGHAPGPPGGGTVHDDAADLAALMEHLGLAPAHVACNSLGGNVAMRLAARRPEIFRSLALHEPPVFDLLRDDPDDDEAVAGLDELMGAVASLIEAGDMDGAAGLFVDNVAAPGAWAEAPPEVRAAVAANAPTFLEELRDPDLMGADLVGLARCDRRTLLTTGETDFPLFDRAVARLLATFPDCRHRVLEGAGHEPHLSRPELYAQALREFILGT